MEPKLNPKATFAFWCLHPQLTATAIKSTFLLQTTSLCSMCFQDYCAWCSTQCLNCSGAHTQYDKQGVKTISSKGLRYLSPKNNKSHFVRGWMCFWRHHPDPRCFSSFCQGLGHNSNVFTALKVHFLQQFGCLCTAHTNTQMSM